MKVAKVFGLIIVFLLGLVGLEYMMHCFDYPLFPGEAYLALVGFAAVLFLVAKAVYSIVLYAPKPKPTKEG